MIKGKGIFAHSELVSNDMLAYTFLRGRPIEAANANGTITHYGYDQADRITSIQTYRSDGSIIASHGFAGGMNVYGYVSNNPLKGYRLIYQGYAEIDNCREKR